MISNFGRFNLNWKPGEVFAKPFRIVMPECVVDHFEAFDGDTFVVDQSQIKGNTHLSIPGVGDQRFILWAARGLRLALADHAQSIIHRTLNVNSII